MKRVTLMLVTITFAGSASAAVPDVDCATAQARCDKTHRACMDKTNECNTSPETACVEEALKICTFAQQKCSEALRVCGGNDSRDFSCNTQAESNVYARHDGVTDCTPITIANAVNEACHAVALRRVREQGSGLCRPTFTSPKYWAGRYTPEYHFRSPTFGPRTCRVETHFTCYYGMSY